jgi:hypothetical protein
MSTSSTVPKIVVLLCYDCSHTERIDLFDESFGNLRTQAARAMQNHSRLKYGAGSVLQPIPKDDALRAQRN